MQGKDYKDRVNAFFQELLSLMDKHETVVFISHDNMDPDAVGSILGMAGLLKQVHPKEFSWVVFPASISKLAKKLLESMDADLPTVAILPEGNFLPILLDVHKVGNSGGNPSLSAGGIESRAVIIDHHQPEESLDARLKFIDKDAQSNCELVYYLYEYNEMQPDQSCSVALLAGILYDSGFFRFTNNRTLQVAASIVESGIKVEEIREILRSRMDISERIARLKAGIRADYVKIDSVVIAHSHVSMYEASACRGLIGLGADIALVLAEKDGQVRISGRQNESCQRKHGVNLGLVMREVGKVIGGTGGGHDMAAAANGTGNGPDGMKKAISIIEDLIKSRIHKTKRSDGK